MSGWGDRMYDVHFNEEANARRVAEMEAERDSNPFRGIVYALLFSLPIWLIIGVVLLVVFW